MKYLTTFLIVFITISADCQSSYIVWQQNLGSFTHEGLYGPMIDNMGNLLLAGSTFTTNKKYDAWLVKTDASGNTIWSRTYGGTNDESFKKIKHLTDGNYIVIGGAKSNDGDLTSNRGDYDIWVAKLDSNGNILWQKTYGGTKFDFGYDIVSADDGFIIAGNTASNDNDISNFKGIYDVCLIRIDRLGNIVWEKTLGGSLMESVYCIQKTNDNNFIILADSRSTDGDIKNNNGIFDVWLLKIDITGKIVWQKNYGGSNIERPTDLKQTHDNGYIICAYSNSNDKDVTGNYGDYDVWVLKTNDTGKIIWQKNYGGSKYDDAFSIISCKEGGYMLAGSSGSNDGDVSGFHNGSFRDVLTLKIDDDGTIRWSHLFGGSEGETAYNIVQSADSNYIFSGPTNSSDGDVIKYFSNSDPWLVKFYMGFLMGIQSTEHENYFRAYPNPAKDFIVFEYNFPKSQDITVTITNIRGELIDNIKLSNNMGKKIWDTRLITSGVYLYTVTNTKGIINTGRMIVSN